MDDDADIRDSVKIFLEKEGYKVILAKNGKECLSIMKNKNKPDLIILDVMMPNLSGYEVAKNIRENFSSSIPILFLTILNTSNDLVTSFDVGGSEFITKPCNFKKLKEIIEKLLAKKIIKRINVHKL
ncbi:MAG: response regulator [Candidatus Nanoarchaeia archaeon]|nr:response regulator [Candidatus Nanoarchaeia archaeon]